MTKILVTGATGDIGKRTIAALQGSGHEVAAGVRSPAQAGALAALGAQPVAFDFGDPASMRAALAGVDRLFVITPFVEFARPPVEAALSAAREAGVGFVVRMSAYGADLSSAMAIGRDHAAAEQAVIESGLRWSVLRPSFFQDNPLRYQGGAIAATGAFYGAAEQGASSSVSPDDVAAVAAAILREPDSHVGKTYTLTGPEALTEPQVAALLSEASGREVRYVSMPSEQLLASMIGQQAPAWQAQALVDLESVKRNGWAAGVSPDVERILGRRGQTLVEYLAAHPRELDPIRAR
ncbi:NAD(P)H-binding protein [Nannocystaceae bacterium ST9]